MTKILREDLQTDYFCESWNSDSVAFYENGQRLPRPSYWKNSKEIILPEGITRIKEATFAHCSKLETIKIPNSVVFIDEKAFLHCESLVNIEIPKSVNEIHDFAFADCSKLSSISFTGSGKGPGVLGANVFSGCVNLKTFTVPDIVYFIGYRAFSDCSNLTSINIPNSVKRFDGYTFANCYSLKNITIPDSVNHLGYAEFTDCRSLKTVSLPKHLNSSDLSIPDGCEIIIRNKGSSLSNCKVGMISKPTCDTCIISTILTPDETNEIAKIKNIRNKTIKLYTDINKNDLVKPNIRDLPIEVLKILNKKYEKTLDDINKIAELTEKLNKDFEIDENF